MTVSILSGIFVTAMVVVLVWLALLITVNNAGGEYSVLVTEPWIVIVALTVVGSIVAALITTAKVYKRIG